jgi:hypothetical protein
MRLRPLTYYRDTRATIALTGNRDVLPDYPSKYDIDKIKFSGFMAQEVEAAAKASGYDFSGVQAPKNSSQLYSLSYETFVVPLVKAVQEQQQMIDELRSSLIEIKQENMTFKLKLAQLQTGK